MDGFQSANFGVSARHTGNMDINEQVEKLKNETSALKNEIWGLKEIVTQQNANIIKLLKEKPESLKTNVKSTKANAVKTESSSKPHVKRFPIETQDDLDNIEDEIDANNKDEIASHISKLIFPGGFQKNMLKILSDDIVMSYNIAGTHSKKKLSDYKMLMEVFFKATESQGWNHTLFIDDLRKGIARAKKKHTIRNWALRKKSKMNQSNTEEMDMFDIKEIALPFT